MPTVLIVVPVVVAMAVVVITAFFTPMAVLWCWCLPGHHRWLVVSNGLHHTVMRPGLVIGYRWCYVVLRLRLVVSTRLLVVCCSGVLVGCITPVMVLAGNACTHQPAGTRSQNRAIAAADRLADGRTRHRADTGTDNGIEVIRAGLWG